MNANKKSKNVINIVSRVIAVMWVLLSATIFTVLLILNILPMKYLGIIMIIYIPILILMFILLWLKKFRMWVKIAIGIIGLIFVCALSFGNFYMYKTLRFMNSIRTKDYQIQEYYVMVASDSSYNKLADITSKKTGIFPLDTDTYDEAILELNNRVTVKKQEYQDFIKMGQDLLNHKVEAIFVSLTHKTIIEDLNSDFQDNTKIIATISIKVDNTAEVKEVNVSKESFNIYISGIDVYGNISKVSRSDVNIVMTVNPNTNQILLTSIPRDYYVQLDGTKGYKDKLTHAGLYGVDKSIKTIEKLLDININYYLRVNFTAFIKIIDAIDGINIYSDIKFNRDGVIIEKGMNHLNGTQALVFARERHSYIDGDRQRGKNQQAVIAAIIKKAMSSKTIVTNYLSILKSLGNSFETNMDSSKIYDLVNMQLDQMPNWNIDSISLNGSDGSEYTYSYSKEKLYVMIPDMNTVYMARQKINSVEGSE